MASISCKITGFLILNILKIIFGITIFVLAIVFNIFGFSQSALNIGICTNIYLITKNTFQTNQFKISFIFDCIATLMFSISLALIIMTSKKLKQQIKQNPQYQSEKLSEEILSRTKYASIYIINSLGGLGVIVGLGSYLTFFLDTTLNGSTCSFTYNSIDLIILAAISGIWLLLFLASFFILLSLNENFKQDQKQKKIQNKYAQMANLTQQPEAIHKGQYTDQQKINNTNQNIYEGSNLNTFGNQNNSMPSIFTLNVTHENHPMNRDTPTSRYHPKNQVDARQPYRNKQINQDRNKKNLLSNLSPSQSNNKSNLISNRFLNESDQNPQFHFKPNESENKPKQNVRYFNESSNPNRFDNNQIERPPISSNRYNTSRNDYPDTKGQLVFHKKVDNKSPYDPVKSPTTNFMREQQDYLRNNVRGSILPNGYVKQSSPEKSSRKRIFDQPYNDVYKSSKFQDSNQNQNRSRVRSRQGVLTSYIRGKFN